MAPEAPPSRRAGGDGPHMKLLYSHGGRLVPRGPDDGAIRYAGGETRVLAVPRDVSFRELITRLAEMAGGAQVLAVRHRLADEGLEDVLVSVTCDAELAHMRDEYDRLCAARPAARFRVFVTTTSASAGSGAGGVVHRGMRSAAAGLPPLAPKMRRVQSEQAQLQRRPAYPAPVRRVQSAQEFAGASHAQQSFHHQQCRCSCSCHRPAYPAPVQARPMHAAPYYMSKKVAAAPSSIPAAKATGRRVVFLTDAATEKARSRDSQAAAMEDRRAIWEFE